MTDPSLDERAAGTSRDHPPLRMRERRSLLLPDLRPPSLEELRWAARQRRERRESPVPQPRRPHGPADQREPADMVASIEVPVVEVVEVVEVDDALPVMSWPEPITTPALGPAPQPAAEVEPAGEPDPGRIAVLDEVEAPTVTRLVPLLAEPSEAIAVEPPAPVSLEDDFDAAVVDGVIPEVPAAYGRAAPLYWRLLRLRYTQPNGWLRALFFEGAVAVAVVLVLAEAASVWTIVVLPFVVAVVVKANDVLAGNLKRSYRAPGRRSGG